MFRARTVGTVVRRWLDAVLATGVVTHTFAKSVRSTSMNRRVSLWARWASGPASERLGFVPIPSLAAFGIMATKLRLGGSSRWRTDTAWLSAANARKHFEKVPRYSVGTNGHRVVNFPALAPRTRSHEVSGTML